MKLGNISRQPDMLNTMEREQFHSGYHYHHAYNRNQGNSNVRLMASGDKGG